MAVSFVAANVIAQSANNATAISKAISSIAVNDLIVVGVGMGNKATDEVSAISLSTGAATWTKVTAASKSYTGGGDTNYVSYWFGVVTTAGTTPTISISKLASCEMAAVIQQFTGFTAAPTLDQATVKETDNSKTCTSGATGTLSSATEVAVGVGTDNAGTGQTYTDTAGWLSSTSTINSDISLNIAYQITAATTALTYGSTLKTSTDNTGSIATFVISSGGTTVALVGQMAFMATMQAQGVYTASMNALCITMTKAQGSLSTFLALFGRAKASFKASGAMSQRTFLAARATAQAKARATGLFSLPLAGRAAAQAKAKATPNTFLALAGRVFAATMGRITFSGRVSLAGRATSQVKAQGTSRFNQVLTGMIRAAASARSTIRGNAAIAGMSKFMVTARMPFAGRAAMRGNVMTLTKAKAGGTFSVKLSGIIAAKTSARGLFKMTTALKGATRFMVTGLARGMFAQPMEGRINVMTAARAHQSLGVKLVGIIKTAFTGRGFTRLIIDSRAARARLSACETYAVALTEGLLYCVQLTEASILLALSVGQSYLCELSEPEIIGIALSEILPMQCDPNKPILIGTELPLRATFTDLITGQLVDPSTIVLKVKDPTGTVTDYTPTRQSLGVWSYNYLFSVAGVYFYRFEASGNFVAVGEKSLMVAASQVD